MTIPSTSSASLRDTAERHSVSITAGLRAPALAAPIVTTALTLGITGDALFRGPTGAAFPVWMALICLSAVALVWRGGWSVSREALGWLVTAVAFATAFAWRDSETLQFFDVVTSLAALIMAAAAIHDPRDGIFASRFRETATGVFNVILSTLVGVLPLVVRDLLTPTTQHSWGRTIRPGVRTVAIVAVLLFVFGSLLRSADPIFASFISLPSFDFGELISHVLLIGVLTWGLAGGMRSVFVGARSRSATSIADGFRLGMLETTATLATLDLLFAAFVAAQVGWFFGGEHFLQERTGLTAAEYARQGFFQMIWVVVLVVPLLVATRAQLRPDRTIARRHTMLSLPLVALLGAILLSAALRMRLYVHYYGLSTDRFYPLIFMAWLGGVLLWLSVTVLRSWGRPFIGGAVISGLVTLAALNVASPDAIVARVNIERGGNAATSAAPLDLTYLAQLGGEASLAATQAVIASPRTTQGSAAFVAEQKQRCDAARKLINRWGPASRSRQRLNVPAAWRYWNAGEAHAFRVVQEHGVELLAVTHSACVHPTPAPAQR